ncbi:MAG: hypothetical protein VKL42_19435 [Snowella sp.]|nr:hypothetical protein [Snowella sp.]
MNAILGYGISLLFFMTGVLIPLNTDQADAPSGVTEQVEIVVENPVWAESQGIRESEPPYRAKRNLPQLPPVRDNHAGRREAVPQDQGKRCPGLEPVFEAYGLYPIETWSYIAWRESGCRPKAQNATWDANGNMTYALNKDGSYDTGLLQINSSWYSVVKDVCGEKAVENHMQGLKTVHCNLMVARFIMNNSKGGLANWRM